MMNQVAIERDCGIDEAVAKHMMAKETPSARNAMSLLQMQCNMYDAGGYALLKQAVADCKKEMAS